MDVDSDNAFPRTKFGRDHQVRDQFRHGQVIDREKDDKKGPRVRVQFHDKQGLISYWLPVKQFGSRKTVHFYVPKIGDIVCVNMLANGSEDGFVDGSFFNASNPPPEGVDIDTRHFLAADETVIEYREIDHTFNLNDPSGPVMVQATEIHIIATAGIVEITSPTTIILTAPTVVINANIVHTGNMTTSGVHTDANGIHGGILREEVENLKERVRLLEERLHEIENSTR
jgi:phage baseplate assembly protein V